MRGNEWKVMDCVYELIGGVGLRSQFAVLKILY